MAAGDLTTGTIAYVDSSNPTALAAAIDAINLTAVTDMLQIVPVGHGTQVAVFKVEREA